MYRALAQGLGSAVPWAGRAAAGPRRLQTAQRSLASLPCANGGLLRAFRGAAWRVPRSRTTLPRRSNSSAAVTSAVATGTDPSAGQQPRPLEDDTVSHATLAKARPAHHDEATKQAIFGLVDRLHQNEEELATLLDQTGLLSEFESLAYSENLDLADTLKFIVGYRDEHDLLVDVRRVRQVFGDYPPVEWMTEEAVRAFTRLYGPPLQKPEPRPEEEDAVENEVAESESDHSGVSGEEGGVCPPKESRPDQGQAAELDAVPPMPAELEARMQEVARTLGGELVESEPPDDGSHALAAEAADREPPQPLHELTERGRFRIGDSMTLTLPEDTMVAGVGSLLRDYANKHLREAAARTFGRPQLPQSLRIPRSKADAKPLPISANQHYMSDMEANMFMAVLYPGLYASTLSILSEVGRRAGQEWLQGLLRKDGGARFLDAGAGGAAALAWRNLLASATTDALTDSSPSLVRRLPSLASL